MNRLGNSLNNKKKIRCVCSKEKNPPYYILWSIGVWKKIYIALFYFIIFINPKKKLKNTSCILIAHIVKELNLFEMN